MSFSRKMKDYQKLFKSLYGASRNHLGFEPHPTIVLIKNKKNSDNPLGKTAFYDPSKFKIAIYSQGRHVKDILRSLSHELVHHAQNCRGDFSGGAATVEGYAQEDGHLRELEREAYEVGNMIFRDWEDNLKSKGGVPLFTSTHYTPPYTSDVVGGRLVEGDKMKKKVNESHLRNIIRGVIQEMFNDDLNEASGFWPQSTQEEEAEAAQRAASAQQPYEAGVGIGTQTEGHDYDVKGTPTKSSKEKSHKFRYLKGKVAGSKVYEDAGEAESWNDWKNEHSDDNHIEEMKRHLRALEHDRDYERKSSEYDHDKFEDEGYKNESLNEDGSEDEAWHDWMNEHADDNHIRELEHHLRALKEDRDYEEEHADYDEDEDEPEEEAEEVEEEVEELDEVFAPTQENIRSNSRASLNERLTKLWAKK